MAISKDTTSKKWQVNIEEAGKRTLSTAGKFVDADIEINTPAGSVGASVAADNLVVNVPTVTPSLDGTIQNAVGITSTKPAGVDGTDYLTLNPEGSSSTGSVSAKATATISKEGYIETSATTTQATATSKDVVATVAEGTTQYLPINTLTNSIVSGSAYVAEKGDQMTVTVSIPAGYHKAVTLTKDFTNLLPDFDANEATSDEILFGEKAYDENGKVVTGTMPNNGAAGTNLAADGDSYTIPAGYHNGEGTVTANLTKTSRTAGDTSLSLTAGAGSVAASSSNVEITAVEAAGAGDFYFTATGSGTVSAKAHGTVSTGTGWITSGSTDSKEASKSLSSNSASQIYKVQKAVLGAEGSSTAVPHAAATGVATSTSATSYYVTSSATGTYSASASTATEGYTKDATASAAGEATPADNVVTYLAENTITGSVVDLTAPSVAVSAAASAKVATSTEATAYYVEATGTATPGSVKGKATAGNVNGIVAANTTNTSAATVINSGVTGSGTKVYLKAAELKGATTTLGSSDVNMTLNSATGVVTAVVANKSANATLTAGYTEGGSATVNCVGGSFTFQVPVYNGEEA